MVKNITYFSFQILCHQVPSHQQCVENSLFVNFVPCNVFCGLAPRGLVDKMMQMRLLRRQHAIKHVLRLEIYIFNVNFVRARDDKNSPRKFTTKYKLSVFCAAIYKRVGYLCRYLGNYQLYKLYGCPGANAHAQKHRYNNSHFLIMYFHSLISKLLAYGHGYCLNVGGNVQ